MELKFRKLISLLFLKVDRFFFSKHDFVIISNNCWGAEIYKRLGKRYNTPFVGLFLYSPDYIKLLQNFDYYMSLEVKPRKKSIWVYEELDYPLGQLGDIEIHFMHYKNFNEAFQKWNRRVKRMKLVKDKDKFFFKICDRDKSTKSILKTFHDLPFKNKVSFSVYNLNLRNNINIKSSNNTEHAPDGVILYRLTHNYFDLFYWIKFRVIKNTMYNNLKTSLRL